MTAPETLLTSNKLHYVRDMLSLTKFIPGDVLEIGVYRGGTLWHIANDVKSWECNKRVTGYDTFIGLPRPSEIDVHKEGDFSNTNIEDVAKSLDGLDVKLVKGLYPITALPGPISFVHLDVDLYWPTVDALEYLSSKMVRFGLIVLDDYKWKNCPGIEKAVHEFLDRHKTEFRLFGENQYQITIQKL